MLSYIRVDARLAQSAGRVKKERKKVASKPMKILVFIFSSKVLKNYPPCFGTRAKAEKKRSIYG